MVATPSPRPAPQPASAPAAQAPAPAQHGQANTFRKLTLTAWEGIWYVVQNIAFGWGYLAKVPAKKALHDFGLVEMTSAEQFWYIFMCIPFGAAYFVKIPTAKALTEVTQIKALAQSSHAQFGLSAAESGR
jgi:hypothetical protein